MAAIPTMMKGTTKKTAATPCDYVGHSRAHSEAASRAALIFPANTLSLLKNVAGRQTTVLTHYGRKTGNFPETTIWFVLDGDKLYTGTANVNRQWVRNVQKTPKIRLTIGGETFRGTARFLTERSEHQRAMAAIRRKYWMFRPIIELGRILSANRSDARQHRFF